MAKKQKTKAHKAAKAPKAPKGPGKPRVASNVYTGMTFIATVMLITALTFVLIRSSQLFGGIGELFNLDQSSRPSRVQRSAPATTDTPAAAPAPAPAKNQ